MTDVLIVGCGLAGLYTALHIDPSLSVMFVSKESVDDSSSWLAQGGIAAAVGEDDTPEFHVEDTLTAGAGLCDEQAVRVLTTEGPEEIQRLINMRVPFDMDEDGDLAITREGGHTRNRVVHAGGDATGRETVRVLTSVAAACPNISYMSNCFVSDVITRNGSVCGVTALIDGEFKNVSARYVVLATGGVGQLYSRTTNPDVATGDGIAIAIRAGAELRDMEFIQFHPTGLFDSGKQYDRSSAFLISEAVRGEGAVLRNCAGERFMKGQHPMAELAPRDIVTRCIVREMERTGEPCVYLDATDIPEEQLKYRFPTIYGECGRRGIDIARQWIPVCPVQHYLVGGVNVDLHARTSISGLYAVGEVSCTGVHGANRLASNSMLECLVFGRRAAEHINNEPLKEREILDVKMRKAYTSTVANNSTKEQIRSVCDRCAGVIRTEQGLLKGLSEIEEIINGLDELPERSWLETRNMALTAQAVIKAALARRESVGTHYII